MRIGSGSSGSGTDNNRGNNPNGSSGAKADDNGHGYLISTMESIFKSHDDITYMVALNDKMKIIAQQGFLELHPSKLDILHVQASLMVNMSSVWSESMGTLDYVSASFDAKSEIMVMPVSRRLHLVAVLSYLQKKSLENTRLDILKQFKAIQNQIPRS